MGKSNGPSIKWIIYILAVIIGGSGFFTYSVRAGSHHPVLTFKATLNAKGEINEVELQVEDGSIEGDPVIDIDEIVDGNVRSYEITGGASVTYDKYGTGHMVTEWKDATPLKVAMRVSTPTPVPTATPAMPTPTPRVTPTSKPMPVILGSKIDVYGDIKEVDVDFKSETIYSITIEFYANGSASAENDEYNINIVLKSEIEPSDEETQEVKFSENNNTWAPDQESVTSREYKVIFTWQGEKNEGASASLTVNVRECAGNVESYIDDIKSAQEVIDAYEELESSIPHGGLPMSG